MAGGRRSHQCIYLLTAYEKRHPVHALRSGDMPETNAYRPAIGIRYDGLYRIIRCRFFDAEKSDYRFNMRRIPGHDRQDGDL